MITRLMSFISWDNVVRSCFHNLVSSYEMDSNYAFRISKSDLSIITGFNVGLNVVLQLKMEFWDRLAPIVVCLCGTWCVWMFYGQTMLIDKNITSDW